MADLGNLYFDILLRDMTDKDIDRIKKKLEKIGVKIGADVNRKTLEKNIREALKNKTFKVNLEAGKNIKKAAIEANKSILTNSVSNALKGKVFTADLKLAIKSATVQDAIKQAFAKAGLQYNTTASDVRAQRIAEIQQRMAIRAANAQRNLGNSYRYAANGAYESARASVVLGRSFHTNIRLAGELGTAMGNFASVFGIKDVLENLVLVGGQLENQRIALGAILQDGGKATEMFGKIQSLAVKSPFGIMDLNQYTKQLSAYGIEYNELYDTMKRMADISAGVGVDMGRIILAFGQVKAAGFLKGTELRQFTEANIPMVDKLAERFSNLEKRIVSAGEVYDMISKKKVTFEDVKSVLWDLTGEGGMFNNMQEILSESLASKWKNLADAIDVMYGKIADGAIGGGLKNLAVFLTELTKNWEYLATAIGSASAAFVAYKASVAIGSGKGAYGVYNIIAANHQLEVSNLRIARSYRALSASEQGVLATKERFTAAELRQAAAAGVLTKEMTLRLIAMGKISVAQAGHLKQILGITRAEIAAAAATSKWKVALAVFGNTLNGVWLTMKAMLLSPWTWAFAGITAITELFTYYGKKQDEIEERNKNFAESAKGSAETLERELLKIKDLDISKMNTDEMKIKVKELTTVIQNEADGWQSILSEIFEKEADGTFKNSVEEQLKLLKTKMDELAEAKKRLMKDNESYSDVIGETETGALFWEKDIIDRVKAYSQAVDENDKKLKDLAIHAREVSAALTAATSNNAVIQQVFNGKSLNEQVAILKDYKEEWSKFIVELTKSSPEAAQTVNSWFNSIEKYFVKGKNAEMMWDFGVAKDKMIEELTLQGEEIGKLTETGRQYVIGFVDGLIKEAAVQKPSVQQYIYDWFTGQFGLLRNDLEYIVPTNAFGGNKTEYDPSKDEVAKLWKKRSEEIDKAVKMYDQWKKLEGSDKARARVQAKDELANLFGGAYGFNLDLENPTKAYEFIQSKLNKNLSAQKELMVQLGVKISDAEFKDAQDKLKANMELLKREAEKTIQGWGLYKRLFEATGDKKTSMNIAFGGQISFKDKLEHLRSQIESEMGKLGATIPFEKLIGMDTKDLEAKGLGGLTDLIEKYNRENAKLKEESVKNFIDIIEASKDFAAQVQDIERKLEKDLKDLRANANGADTTRAEAQLRKNTAEAISKVNFEEFKQSSDWIRVFDDLNRVSDATLDNMIAKIEEFARHGKMSEEVTKQIVDAMAKLRKETIERNPFEGFESAWKRLKYFKGLRSKVGEYDEHGKLITQQMADDGIAEANDDLEKAALAIAGKFNAVADAADMLSGVFKGFSGDLEAFGGILNSIESGAKSGANIASALGIVGPWGAVAGAALGLLSSAFELHDKALQKEIEASEARIKMINNLADNLKQRLSSAEGGIYSVGIDSATKKVFEDFIEGFNGWQKYQNSSPRSAKYREYKEYNYLSKDTIDTMQSAISSDSYYRAQMASLKLQKDELNKQKEDLERAKNRDETKIQDKIMEIEQIEYEIAEFRKTMMDAIYGINFKDWASQFTDSIVDAWAKGEDAADAYQRTVSNVMRNVAASVIQQSLIGKWLEDNMENVLALFERNGGVITDDVFNAMAELASGIGGKVEEVEQFMDYWEKALNKYNLSMKDLESTEKASSGLSKGIQSVTEDTANLLASYVNSMRADLSVNRTLIEQLVSVDVPQMSIIAQAQLQQLQQVAANTKRNADAADRIYELVNKVVDKGSNKLKI